MLHQLPSFSLCRPIVKNSPLPQTLNLSRGQTKPVESPLRDPRETLISVISRRNARNTRNIGQQTERLKENYIEKLYYPIRERPSEQSGPERADSLIER